MAYHDAVSRANTLATAAEVTVSKQGKRKSASTHTIAGDRNCDEKWGSERQLGGEWVKELQELHPPGWSKKLKEDWRDGPGH